MPQSACAAVLYVRAKHGKINVWLICRAALNRMLGSSVSDPDIQILEYTKSFDLYKMYEICYYNEKIMTLKDNFGKKLQQKGISDILICQNART